MVQLLVDMAWKNIFFIVSFDTSAFFIQGIGRLNWHNIEKVKDKIDTIERLETKLKYGVKNRDQLAIYPSLYYLNV